MGFIASTTSTAAFGLGVLLMIVILLRRSARYQKKLRPSKSRRALSRREPDREQPLIDAPVELLRWQVEMHETARDLKGELDSKMGAIQALIRRARDEVERLDHAVERARRLGISESPDSLVEIERLARDASPTDPDLLGKLPRAADASTNPHFGSREVRDQVFALADRGCDAGDIAQQVGATAGEVEMMLSLRSASGK